MKILPTRKKAPSKIRELTKIKNWFFCVFFNSIIKLKTALNPKQMYNKISIAPNILKILNILIL